MRENPDGTRECDLSGFEGGGGGVIRPHITSDPAVKQIRVSCKGVQRLLDIREVQESTKAYD